MRAQLDKAYGFARAYWPALLAAGVAVLVVAAGVMTTPSDREAAAALEDSHLTFKAIPYRLRDAASRPVDPESVLPLVEAFVRNGQQTRAIEVLETYLRQNTDDLRAHYQAARLAEWENRPHDTARHKLEVLRIDPEGTHPEAENVEQVLRSLADYLIWQKRPGEAGDLYLRLLEVHGDETNLLLRAADVLVWGGRFQEAGSVLERAAALSPDELDSYLRLGRVYTWTGETAPAIGAYERAVQVNPDSLGAWIELSRLYQAAGMREKLAEAFEQISRLQ